MRDKQREVNKKKVKKRQEKLGKGKKSSEEERKR